VVFASKEYVNIMWSFYASEGFYNRRRWRFKKRSTCKLKPLLADVGNNKCECFYSIFEKKITAYVYRVFI
jgi:hypothetical protein